MRKFRFYYQRPDGEKFYHCDTFCSIHTDARYAKVYECPRDKKPEEQIFIRQKNIIWENFQAVHRMGAPMFSNPKFFGGLGLDDIKICYEEILPVEQPAAV